MRRCRTRLTSRWTHGVLAAWRWAKLERRNYPSEMQCANIETSNWAMPELKQRCSNATQRAQFATEIFRTRNCARASSNSDVSADRFRRDNEEHCCVDR